MRLHDVSQLPVLEAGKPQKIAEYFGVSSHLSASQKKEALAWLGLPTE